MARQLWHSHGAKRPNIIIARSVEIVRQSL